MEDMLTKIVEIIGSYEIIINFLPGIATMYLVERFSDVRISTGNFFVDVCVCFLLGIVIGRISSVVVEPLLNKITKKASMDEYLSAEQIDKKIPKLNAINNLYRSLLVTFLVVFLAKIYSLIRESLSTMIPSFPVILQIVVFLLMIILFAFSYRKQTELLRKRIEHVNRRNETDDN